MKLRQFWTPTRPLFGRLRIGKYGEYYDLYPGDLLTHGEGVWIKVAPGITLAGFRVDVFDDNLQAVVVDWQDHEHYLFLEVRVGLDKLAELGLRAPIPVPVWPEPEPPEPKPHRPMRGPWG